MKLAIFGNNDGPLYLLQSLVKAGSELPGWVAVQKPLSPALARSYQTVLGYVPPIAPDEAALLQRIAKEPPDLLINCFGNFIFRSILQRVKVWNIHPSPLPAYRGRHPMHWALIRGEREFGITLHEMTPEVDEGALLWQETTAVQENWSVRDLRSALLDLLEAGFAEFLKNFNRQEARLPDPKFKSSYFRPRVPGDSLLDFGDDPEKLYRKVNALREETYPAFAQYDDKTLEFRRALLNHDTTKTFDVHIEQDQLRINYPGGSLLTLWSVQSIPNTFKSYVEHACTFSRP